MKEYPWGKGTPKWVRDATANDSDKSFTVPAGKIWKLQYVLFQLSASATVGNRYLRLTLSDGTNEMYSSNVTAAIAASAKGALLMQFGSGAVGSSALGLLGTPATTLTSSTETVHADVILAAGSIIRVLDIAKIDAAADDTVFIVHYVEYDA